MRLVPTSSPTAEAFGLVLVFDISCSPHRRDRVLVFSLQNFAVAIERHAARRGFAPYLFFPRPQGQTKRVVSGETEQCYARQRALVVVAQPQIVERQVGGPVGMVAGTPVRWIYGNLGVRHAIFRRDLVTRPQHLYQNSPGMHLSGVYRRAILGPALGFESYAEEALIEI